MPTTYEGDPRPPLQQIAERLERRQDDDWPGLIPLGAWMHYAAIAAV